MKELATRMKRAVKELLGMPQWPKEESIHSRMRKPLPRSFEEQIYISVVRTNDLCLDVGANAGEVSVLLARLAGKGGHVVAFEPVWPVYMRLCRNIRSADGSSAPIVAVPYGLAEAKQDAIVHVPAGAFGMASLAPAAEWSKAQQGAELVSYNCHFETLDGFLESSRLPAPDFIKIDVEGAELLVLRGASKHFGANNRPLMLIELFAPWERAFKYGPWDVLSLLQEIGYRFLFACPNGLVEHQPSEACPFPVEYANGYNIVAYLPEKHAERIKSLDGLRTGGGDLVLPMPPPPLANTLA